MAQHPHDHGATSGRGADQRFLAMALALLGVFLVVEVTVALLADSLALLSDAGHMLTDVAAIAAALWAARLAGRPAGGAWTFGWTRAEILSAAVNGASLLVISALVTVEAIRRLADPPHVDAAPMLTIALVGVAVNVAVAGVLARANRSSLAVEGAFQHVLTDLYGFLGTVAAAIVILATGYRRADPIASLLVVGLMLLAAWRLLRASGRVLLEAAPESVEPTTVRAHLLGVTHVLDVHDLHVWTLTSDLPALSAHIVLDDSCFADNHAPQLLDQLQACLAGHFDVEHSTFQLEPASHADHEPGTH
ncbi:MAG: cobalt-zinc-cadmium efflux system protein [Pseudonocardiales bacterium]|nr:cobalt-zinc-cadmium efflux system protein [Pseudonocardiales bacterium]